MGRFVRGIIGLEVSAAKEAFRSLIRRQTLNSQQIKFIDQIIDFFSHEGYIGPIRLFESPFTDIDSRGITSLFDMETSDKIVKIIQEVNNLATVVAYSSKEIYRNLRGYVRSRR